MNKISVFEITYRQPSKAQFDCVMVPMSDGISKIKQPAIDLVKEHLGAVHRSLESEMEQSINNDKTLRDRTDQD